jgi:hypothetical protein
MTDADLVTKKLALIEIYVRLLPRPEGELPPVHPRPTR